MTNKKLIIFDFDGTIIDSSRGIVDSFNFALVDNNYAKIDSEDIKKLIGLPLEKMFLSVSSSEHIENLCLSFRSFYNTEGWKLYDLYPKIDELIRLLYQKKFILTIATTKKQPSVDFILLELDLYKYFDQVVDGSMVARSKPEIESFELIQAKFPNIKRENMLMIGDTSVDQLFARNSGIQSVIVSYGFGDVENSVDMQDLFNLFT